MAGRLPGVGVPSRKREQHHNHHTHQNTYSRGHSLSLEEPPWLSLGAPAMDETVLRARQRLQKKLGHFSSTFRANHNIGNEGKVKHNKWCRSWLLRLSRYKKEREVCAVCLEDFQQENKVMSLSCSHKYHSACLLPWLQAHPHCPYCRTPVHL